MFQSLMKSMNKTQEDVHAEHKKMLAEKQARQDSMNQKRERMIPFSYSSSFIKANPLKFLEQLKQKAEMPKHRTPRNKSISLLSTLPVAIKRRSSISTILSP